MTILELTREIEKKSNKYIHILQSYGYQDVHVKIPLKTLQTLDDLYAYFWRGNYGYSLEIQSDKAVSDYSDFFGFLEDWKSLQNCTIREILVNHLEHNSYAIQHISQWTAEGHGRVKAHKDGITYTIELSRDNIKEPRVLQNEDDDPIEFEDDEIQEYIQEIGSYIQRTFKINDYTITASSDLKKADLVVTRNFVRHSLEVWSCTFDFTWDINHLLEKIIFCFLSGREIDTGYSLFENHLNSFHFHIVGKVCENSPFRVYGEGAEFEIRFRGEKLPGYVAPQAIQNAVIDFDHMEGHAFEHFCAKVLVANGFENVRVTQGSGDQGIDIIAHKDGIKYGIQCKCYSADIGNKAVQEALGGRLYYNCHVGVVLTNRYFTKAAVDLAKSTSIVLWNRDKLISMVENLML